jgi:hypothetical protein
MRLKMVPWFHVSGRPGQAGKLRESITTSDRRETIRWESRWWFLRSRVHGERPVLLDLQRLLGGGLLGGMLVLPLRLMCHLWSLSWLQRLLVVDWLLWLLRLRLRLRWALRELVGLQLGH